ncbi:MAG TPA: hypothetical protein V6D30_09285 [Leptolyngbyaceae cyanobacterium]
MNIPNNLAEELKLYLKQKANNGDLEAQALLAQMEQVITSQAATMQQAMDVPPEGGGLGC